MPACSNFNPSKNGSLPVAKSNPFESNSLPAFVFIIKDPGVPFSEEIFSPKLMLTPLFFIASVNAEESSKSNPLKIRSPRTN